MNEKQPAVYILASERSGTLYVGVTSNLPKRIWNHQNGTTSGFSKEYNVRNLVFFEIHETMGTAITREKQLKNGIAPGKFA